MEQLKKDFLNGLSQSIALTKSPATQWESIRAQQSSLKEFYISYVLPFAAIGPICEFIVGLRYGVVSAFIGMIAYYIISLVSIFVTAFVIEKLAPKFNGNPSHVEATKLVAYSMAPIFLGGFLSLLGIIHSFLLLVTFVQMLISIYAIYVFYKGVGPMTNVPEDKRLVFVLVSAVVCIVINVCLGVLLLPGVAGSVIGSGAAFTPTA